MEKKSIVIIALLVLSLSVMPHISYQQQILMDTSDDCGPSTVGRLNAGTNSRFIGENVENENSELFGAVIDSIQLTMRKTNAPTGTIYIGVWNSTITPTSANYKLLIDTMLAEDLTTTNTQYFFIGTSGIELEVNDAVGVFYNGGDGSNSISVCVTTDDAYDGTNSIAKRFRNSDTTWVDIPTLDLTARLTTPITQAGFCTEPENINLLICRVGGNGVFGSGGAFIIGQAPTNTTDGTGLTGIGCAIGLVDCIADPDPKTNGLGLLIFVASIFIVVGMFVHTQGMQSTIKLPVYMWAMIIIALSAFFTITQIIDPVFLIISIIGLIALGAPKLVNTFKGGSTFGSGSTE